MPEPHASSSDELIRELDVDPQRGLDQAEVRRRRLQHGPNRLRPPATRSAWSILLAQFRSLILGLLAAAMALSMLNGDWPEAIAIAVVILLNTLIGFVAELRAERSMEALRRLGTARATVRRDGRAARIAAEQLVPGDIVLIEAGDVVAADLRLIECSMLQADESTLTGESVPVEKAPPILSPDTALAERRNMLFRGTAVTRGSGLGLVVATGMTTELGRISQLVETAAADEPTPLERRLDELGRRLVWVALGITGLLAVAGLVTGREPMLVVKTAVALAVAAVPEGLPIVATLALARGMWRMARRNAVVNRLAAVETLGSTNVICTDKTGTLTENRLVARRIATADGTVEVHGPPLSDEGGFTIDGASVDPPDSRPLREILEAGVLCSNASWSAGSAADQPSTTGEPLEVALIVAAAKAGIDATALRAAHPRVREIAFDPEIRLMGSVHEHGDGERMLVKGAPESVMDRCTAVLGRDGPKPLDTSGMQAWRELNEALAAAGLRVLALAFRDAAGPGADPYDAMTLLGLVAMVDPPRTDVAASVEACRRAGIRVVMVTGDHAATARYVAEQVGIAPAGKAILVEGHHGRDSEPVTEDVERGMLEASVLARVTPAQKLDLIRLYRRHAGVVAMTGDGVNDAPALREADIGIAMGQRGTEVARQAADIVLRDDAFSTILVAVEQGRIIFGNIRSFVRYLISCNLSEILVVLVATLAGAPLPILPLQILFLNLVTDVFPALALGLGEGDRQTLERPPRPATEPVLTGPLWRGLVGHGLSITAAVLGAFAAASIWLDLDGRQAVTVSFLALAFAQLWHVLNMRSPGGNVLRNDVTANPYVWGALLLCCGLLVAAVHLPILAEVLQTADPGARGWTIALGMSVLPLLVGQVALAIRPAPTVE